MAPFDAIYSESAGAFGVLISRTLPAIPIIVFLVGTARGEMRSKLRQPLTPRRILAIGWNLASEALSARCVPRATRVLCESEGLRSSVLREIPRLDPARVSVTWLGADTDRFSPEGPILPEFDSLAPSPMIRVLFGGRLEPEKGFDIAIRAVASLARDDVVVFLAGDGKEKDRLIDLGRDRLGPRFHWLPAIPHERLPEMVRGATIYLMPTIREEGSALSLVEAMACEKPVIASAIGGIPTVIANGEDGILVSPGRVDLLADAIRLLLDDPSLRERLGERAGRTARGRFGLETMIDAIETALRAD
jgi:glycosyltransferase involved in cell wall biosynthesis